MKVFLKDLVTNERHDFQFGPETWNETAGAEIRKIAVHGGSFQRSHFANGTGRVLDPVTVSFIRQNLNASDIEEKRKLFSSFPFPDYGSDGQLLRGPHEFRFVFGSIVRRVWVRQVELSPGEWFDPDTLNAGELFVKFTFEEIPAEGDLSREDVLGGR